jgi:hypothetical protein
VVFRNRKISRGNTKSLYGYTDDFISCLGGLAENSLKKENFADEVMAKVKG